MNSSKTCALSGAFILVGGWSAVVWVFLRTVALHLQICWQVVIGKVFMWGALASGWGIPAIAFRFGDTCKSDFWSFYFLFCSSWEECLGVVSGENDSSDAVYFLKTFRVY
jgi:hypothetical protein